MWFWRDGLLALRRAGEGLLVLWMGGLCWRQRATRPRHRFVVAWSRPGSPAAGFRPPAGGRVTFSCLPKRK